MIGLEGVNGAHRVVSSQPPLQFQNGWRSQRKYSSWCHFFGLKGISGVLGLPLERGVRQERNIRPYGIFAEMNAVRSLNMMRLVTHVTLQWRWTPDTLISDTGAIGGEITERAVSLDGGSGNWKDESNESCNQRDSKACT